MLDQLQRVIASFQDHEVKYVVIGGIAAILHGVPRATFDLDVLVEPSPENARKLLDALAAAGLGTATLITPAELLEKEITIFKDVVRVDVQTKTPGIDFASTWRRRVEMERSGQKFFVASRDDLIASKRAAGRAIDLEDVRLLEGGQLSD